MIIIPDVTVLRSLKGLTQVDLLVTHRPTQLLTRPQVTKDGKPLSHSTKWEDISPQGQAYLLELECEPAYAHPALPVWP
jgi:hypothetical protein